MTDMTDETQDNLASEAGKQVDENPSIETTETMGETIETNKEDDGGVRIDPRGALAFVFLVLIFYFGYYMISWFEIFVLRGS